MLTSGPEFKVFSKYTLEISKTMHHSVREWVEPVDDGHMWTHSLQASF